MKKSFIIIIALIIVSFGVILILEYQQRDNSNNGFRRKRGKLDMEIDKVLQLPASFFYFAGISNGNIYLKDLNHLNTLYSSDYSLSFLNSRELNIPADLRALKSRVTIGIIDSAIYLINHKTGQLSLISKKNDATYNFKSSNVRLNNARLISGESIIGKNTIVKGNDLQSTLTKLNYRKSTIEKFYNIEKQFDGLFCSDGMLNYDTGSNRIFYMFYYRGEFLCLDTNLNLSYKSKTIDTVKTALIRPAVTINKTVNKKQVLTQSTPPKVVNRNFTVYKNCMYVMSGLKAENESSSEFKANQVVDVYSINKGNYLYSFNIPKYKGIKLSEFRITDKFVFAIFDNFLIKYNLNNKIPYQ